MTRRIRSSLLLFVPLALFASSCGKLEPLSTEQALDRLNIATTKLFAADGSLIANLHGEINRDIVPLDQIPERVQNAVIAIEDERFWLHRGVDVRGLFRALVTGAQEGGISQGASTISQQLVKNLYFSKLSSECAAENIKRVECRPERNLTRKVREALKSFQFESQYSKQKILEMYLNTIYFGRGVYGIQTAAKSYFNKDAKDLTLAQAAYLAGLIHEPGRYEFAESDAADKRQARVELAVTRRNVVLDKMQRLGLASAEDVTGAKGETLEIFPRGEDRWRYPYFVDMVLRQIGVLRNNRTPELDPRFKFLGDSFEERSRNVYRGGLRIYTTLDPNAQQAAEEAVDKVLPKQLTDLSAALSAVESGTGYVRAVVGGRNYYPDCPEQATSTECRLSKVNLALGQLGGGSGRQPGSSFKPFTLAAALERGVSLNRSFDTSPFSYQISPGNVWKVANYEGSGGGSASLMEGTVNSINAVYAHLLIDGVGEGDALKGAARVADVSRKLGIPFPTEADVRARCGNRYGRSGDCIPADQVPAIALGAKEVAPLDMASAYATFANEGIRVDPTAIVRIDDARGRTLYEADPRRQRVLPRGVALAVTHVLTQVIQRGTGVKARLGRSAAGKTGTAQQWRDAWFSGYVPQLAATVWVGGCKWIGDPKAPSCGPEEMTPSNGYPFRVVGGSFPAMIWQYFMTKALANVPAQPFPAPPSSFFTSQYASPTPGPPTAVPNVVGQPSAAARAALVQAGFGVRESECYAPNAAEGTVVKQTPAAGSEVQKGSSVDICLAVKVLPNQTATVTPKPGAQPQSREATVPDVVGDSLARAKAKLSEAGFQVADQRECAPPPADGGRVWKQSPAGGTTARTGTTVTVWYSPAGCD